MSSIPSIRRGWLAAFATLAVSTSASTALAAPTQARVEIRPISSTGVFGLPTDTTLVPAGDASYDLAATFTVRNADYLILMSGGSGEFTVLGLDDTGVSLGVVQQGEVEGTGWRGLGVGEEVSGPHLYLAKPADGKMLAYPIDKEGRVELASPTPLYTPGLQHKNVFDVFDQGTPRQFALDTFSGGTAVQRAAFPWGLAGAETVSTGWTTADHIDVDGQVYRVLYKEAGDPYSSFGQSPTEEGRARIAAIDGSGLESVVKYDEVLWSGFQLARFVEVDVDTYGFLLYRRDGFTMLRAFDPFSTVVTGTVMSMTSTGFAYDEVLTYRRNGQTFMVGVELETDVDNARKLTMDQMGRLAECVHDNLAHRAVGYQLSVSQGGKQILSRAHGYKRLAPGPLPMTRDSVINYGSVGKLMTTLTTLALDDSGDLNLHGSIAPQLAGSGYGSLAAWVTARTPYNLMTQTSGWTGAATPGCGETDSLEVDCSEFFSTDAPLTCDPTPPPGRLECKRDYVNTNFTALRVLNQTTAGITTTPDLDQMIKGPWLDAVVENGPSCQDDMESKYFQFCMDGDTCFPLGGETYTQADPNRVNGWSRNCGAGGWQGTADDMVAVLEALQGRGILSPANTDLMLDTGLLDLDGGATAVGFEPPYVARAGGDAVLGKNGAGATTSFATLLDGNAQAVLSINSKRGSPEADELFKYAFDFATGASPSCTPMMILSSRDDITTWHDASEVAIDRLPASSRFVVATLGEADQMEVATYKRVGFGVVEDDWKVIGSGSGVEVLGVSASRFVTVMRSAKGNLSLSSYRVDPLGNITLKDTDGGFPVNLAKLAKIPGGGDAELVTAAITPAGNLKVTAWDIALNDTLVERGSYTSPDTFLEASATGSATNGRVVIATRTSTGRVRPLVFDISPDGLTVSRVATAQNQASPPGFDVRVVHVQKEDFTSFYVTAYRTAGNKMDQTSWQITPAGTSIVPIVTRQGGEITRLGSLPRSVMRPYYVVPLIDTSDRARPMGYAITQSSIDTADQPAIGTASDVATLFQFANGRHWSTAAMVTEGKLRIVNVETMTEAP
ncbi:MAG: serine hydrolase domain-containing protein [Deltaproteobacteria bacterium]